MLAPAQLLARGVKSKASCCRSAAAPCMEKSALLWGHRHCWGEHGGTVAFPSPPQLTKQLDSVSGHTS